MVRDSLPRCSPYSIVSEPQATLQDNINNIAMKRITLFFANCDYYDDLNDADVNGIPGTPNDSLTNPEANARVLGNSEDPFECISKLSLVLLNKLFWHYHLSGHNLISQFFTPSIFILFFISTHIAQSHERRPTE